MQMMNVLASHAEIPEGEVAEGRATPGWESAGQGVERRSKFRLHCTEDKPKDAFVAVPYRGHWFWIDDKDIASKRHFAFVMFLHAGGHGGPRRGARAHDPDVGETPPRRPSPSLV
jgi:hypothetical protein